MILAEPGERSKLLASRRGGKTDVAGFKPLASTEDYRYRRSNRSVFGNVFCVQFRSESIRFRQHHDEIYMTREVRANKWRTGSTARIEDHFRKVFTGR